MSKKFYTRIVWYLEKKPAGLKLSVIDLDIQFFPCVTAFHLSLNSFGISFVSIDGTIKSFSKDEGGFNYLDKIFDFITWTKSPNTFLKISITLFSNFFDSLPSFDFHNLNISSVVILPFSIFCLKN